jgi:hypothetical protein
LLCNRSNNEVPLQDVKPSQRICREAEAVVPGNLVSLDVWLLPALFDDGRRQLDAQETAGRAMLTLRNSRKNKNINLSASETDKHQ